ncbi:MAG: YgiW/YdeI family stress tolerance OB fold protein [Deltaproteobacteria bacterium]|jgi:uncharacterized protein (TIGR00156 family)|nr:YgiW/YdeI family stress tolerance OB fold protein [Deltaproteobacteria bacterium]
MRKSLVIVALLCLSLGWGSSLAWGQLGGGVQGGAVGQQGGGFTGPGLSLTTVAEALKLPDDSYAHLKGNIIRHLGKDKYLFSDATGEINVDIDADKWHGQNVTPETTVEIKGEIDKDWNSVEVDVDQIAIVK